MKVTFERQTLYQDVWKTPLTQLSKKFGLSDNGLRKICKAMNIPLPVAGHWAKVAAGHRITPPPLPPEAERTKFVSHPPKAESTWRIAEDDDWLAERIAFEELPENRIVVDMAPRRWHGAVAPMHDELQEAVKKLPKQRRDAERAEKYPNAVRGPDFDGWGWKQFTYAGQVLIATHHSAPMRVTPLTYERALGIFNAICIAAEGRQFSVTLDEKAGRIVLQGHGGVVEMRITERLDDAWRKELRWDKKVENVKYKVPTGVLRLYVGVSYNEREIRDTSEEPLEQRLNDVFVRIYGRVIHARERTREREAFERRYQEEQRRAAEAEERRLAAVARREAELKKRAQLIEEARSWQTAKLIREYLAHLETGEATGRSEDWVMWARKVADEVDPTPKKK